MFEVSVHRPGAPVPARQHVRALARLFAIVLCATAVPAHAVDLLALLVLAEQADPEYREAQHNALAVAETIPQARAALWKPRLNFTTGGARVRQDIDAEFSFGAAGGESAFDRTDYRISVVQPVYHRDRHMRLKQADKRLRQAQLQIDAALQRLMVRLAERYFDVLAAQDNLAFARAEKESLAGQLEQARQRFDVGLIAITDVQEAQAGYDRASALEITAENAVQNAEERLREVTGESHRALWPLGEALPLTRPDPDDIEQWTETALGQNLELEAALVAAEIAADEIEVQRAGHYPSLDIEGGHGFNSTGGLFGQNDTESSDIGVRLNVPLYEGGAVASRTRQAVHEHAGALDRLERTRRAVYRQAREAFLGVVTQIGAVTALRQAVVSSQTALESTRAGFEVGTRTSVDVVTAERGLSQARRDYARARYDYVLNLLRLREAAGTLSPEIIAQTNAWLRPSTGQGPTPATDAEKSR
ncbi:MAG: TolC family outer membrane protein [Gammaproteobacteria bacterium]|nr:TolC family outer membrane protein [Gammaproteobacteria bacterium]